MLITAWDGKIGTALGAQSSGVKEGVSFGPTANYWKEPKYVLRPKESTYVAELDLTGGAGTGIGSPKVAALVNLLKTEGIEGYRPGIYTDSGGRATVGDGFALIIEGSNGYALRSEDEIKGLFRLAGIPVSKYDELPFDSLNSAVSFLRSGNVDAAKALFGNGKTPVSGDFVLDPAQADRLSAAYVVSYTVPTMLGQLGGPYALASLTNGEFVAIGSKTYQQPTWLSKNPGAVEAAVSGDTEALASFFAGTTGRAKAESSALAGDVNTANANLGTSYVPQAKAADATGRWEDQTIYTEQGVPYAQHMVWVPSSIGSTGGTTPGGTPNTANPTNPAPSNAGMTYISRDGASATLGNGKLINAGSGGLLVLESDGGVTVNRPATGFDTTNGVVYDVVSYSRTGQVTRASQVQIVTDPTHPNDPAKNTVLKQGDTLEIAVNIGNGSSVTVNASFQVGIGWVDPGTGELVQSLSSWRASPASQGEPNSGKDDFYKALIDAFSNPTNPGDGIITDAPLVGLQLAAAELPTTDGGVTTGYGNGKYLTVAANGSDTHQSEHLLARTAA